MKKKILVEGPILTQSGYGEHARFVMRSLRSQEDIFDIYAVPLNWGQTSWLFEDDEERRWFDFIVNKTTQYISQKGQFDIYVHVGIPNELKRKAPITVEVTAGIETNKVAPEWIDILNRECNKVITVSEHSKDGLENTSWKAQDQFGRVLDLKLNVPVDVVSYPIKEFNKYTPDYVKEKFPLEYDFNFLCVAQWGPRKNLQNTILWFLEEFKNDNVGLVCKINHSNNSLLDKISCENTLKSILSNFPNRKCKIYLLHGDMNEDEVHNLYNHPQIKAIVNFGHGEGFGLPLYEAAYCGLPVIAVDYSGHRDFLYADIDGKKRAMFTRVPYEMKKIQPESVWNGVLHQDSEWAFVKQSGAKTSMRECYKDYGRFKSQAKKLKEYLNFKAEDVYSKMCDSILGKVKLEPEDFDGISFCIPTNGKRVEKTKLLLNSIRKQTGKPFEIIMCGDVENFRDEKDLILLDEKEAAHSRKVSLLRNKAADKSKYSVIAWCDDDVLLEKDWLENTIKFSEFKGWKVLGNKVLSPDGTRYWDRAILEPHILVSYDHPETDINLYQSSAFFLVRKEIFKINRWNEDCLVFADKEGGIPEDVQFSLDLTSKKIPLMFNETSVVWHNDDTYTEFVSEGISACWKKEEISKLLNTDFFPEQDENFINLVNNA